MTRNLILAALVLTGAAAVGIAYVTVGPAVGGAARSSSTIGDAGGDSTAGPVMTLGWLEPSDGVISLGAIVGDRLRELKVSEGDAVTRGAELAVLDSQPLRQLEYEALVNQVAESKARLTAEESVANARITTAELGVKRARQQAAQIESQQKQVDLLKSSLDLEKKNQQRLDGLSEGLVSSQDRERQALLVKKSETELIAAEAMLKKLQDEVALAIEAADADLSAAKAGKDQIRSSIPIGSLEKQRDLAKEQLDRTFVVAPCDGTVLRVFLRPGEFVSAKPILQMADLQHMVCVAEVYESELQAIQLGQQAVIRSRSLRKSHAAGELHGKVSRIGRMVSTPELKSLDPFARTDRHVIEVRIELDEADCQQAAELINLQVDVTFLPVSK